MASGNYGSDDYSPRRERSTKRIPNSAPATAVIYTTRRQAAKNASKAISASAFDKSMETFNPDMSQREKRKLNKKLGLPLSSKKASGAAYNDRGIHIATGLNVCDCLNTACQGCWFECSRCGSNKCGPECRVFRKYAIESIEYNGYDVVIKNPVNKT